VLEAEFANRWTKAGRSPWVRRQRKTIFGLVFALHATRKVLSFKLRRKCGHRASLVVVGQPTKLCASANTNIRQLSSRHCAQLARIKEHLDAACPVWAKGAPDASLGIVPGIKSRYQEALKARFNSRESTSVGSESRFQRDFERTSNSASPPAYSDEAICAKYMRPAPHRLSTSLDLAFISATTLTN